MAVEVPRKATSLFAARPVHTSGTDTKWVRWSPTCFSTQPCLVVGKVNTNTFPTSKRNTSNFQQLHHPCIMSPFYTTDKYGCQFFFGAQRPNETKPNIMRAWMNSGLNEHIQVYQVKRIETKNSPTFNIWQVFSDSPKLKKSRTKIRIRFFVSTVWVLCETPWSSPSKPKPLEIPWATPEALGNSAVQIGSILFDVGKWLLNMISNGFG